MRWPSSDASAHRCIGVLPPFVSDDDAGTFSFDTDRFPIGPSKSNGKQLVHKTMEQLCDLQGKFVDLAAGVTDQQLADIVRFFKTEAWARTRTARSRADRGLNLTQHWHADQTASYAIRGALRALVLRVCGAR